MATRRDLFALGGLAALGSIGPAEVAKLDMRSYGLQVSLGIYNGKWQVAVLDFENMGGIEEDMPWLGWRPGWVPLIKWMPLEEYLAQVEEVCGLRPKAGA